MREMMELKPAIGGIAPAIAQPAPGPPAATRPASLGRQGGCPVCQEGAETRLAFSFAFQPIVDLRTGSVYAYEALIRGTGGQGALSVLSQVDASNRYAFDQAARCGAIELACRLGLIGSGARLSINYLPNAMYNPVHCVRSSLAMARRLALAPERLILEVVEHEQVSELAKLHEIFRVYRKHGVANALDDFGAGHSGLHWLAELEPEILKLDMALIRGIDQSAARRTIVGAVAAICRALDIRLIAEGIETAAELACLHSLGIDLVQGYLLGRPAFERLDPPQFCAGP